jgi:hypothetical protein
MAAAGVAVRRKRSLKSAQARADMQNTARAT